MSLFRSSKKEVVKEEPFEADREHGILKRKDGARVLAMDSIGWATLTKEMSSTFISGSAVILQRMGYSYGRYLGRVAKAKQKTPEQAFESLQESARESGWGELTLNGGDLSAGQARLVVRHCFFCQHFKDATEPMCHVLEGFVGGMTDEIIGKDHRVSEEKCIAKGDSACEIRVERVG